MKKVFVLCFVSAFCVNSSKAQKTMKKLIVLLMLFIGFNVFSQTIDWVNAPKNPISLKYTLNHFQLTGDVKTNEEFGYNNVLFTREQFTFNKNGFLEQSVYVNKREPLKSDYTTFLYTKEGTVASKTVKSENNINLVETFKYNKNKQLIESFYDNKKYPQHNSNTIFEYFPNGFIKKSTTYKGKKAVNRSEYLYDNLNRVSQEQTFRDEKHVKTVNYSYKKISDTSLEVSINNSYLNEEGNKTTTIVVETYNNGFLVNDKSSLNTVYTLQFDSQNNLLESSFLKLGSIFGGKRYITIYYNPAHNTADNLIDIGCVSGNCRDGFGSYLTYSGLIKGFFKNETPYGFGVLYNTNNANITLTALSGKFPSKKIKFSNFKMLAYVKFVNNKQSGNYYVIEEGKITIAEVENGSIIKKYSNTQNYGSIRCLTGDCDNGFGSLLLENGDSFQGFFKNSQPLEGELQLSSGPKYIGAFENGKKFQGLGVLLFPNGDKYMGFWENGLRHGQGIFQYANGLEEAGTWNNDVLKTKM